LSQKREKNAVAACIEGNALPAVSTVFKKANSGYKPKLIPDGGIIVGKKR
jgi:hypothetical protein